MKYSVSVVKRITLLIMTLALAVAMVACTGATSVKGETGATGAQGETGPAGPPGESSNEAPMAIADKPFKNVYLALGGAGAKPASGDIDPSGHFSDAEKAALTFEAMSSDESVATVTVTAGMLSVTGKGAGSATVTVSAYDGVNTDPATASFDVMVVSDNAVPMVDWPGAATDFSDAETELMEAKILTANGPTMVSVVVSIDAGTAGAFDDAVTVKAIMGKKGAGDDIVSVGLTEKKRGEWEVTLTPQAAGKQTVLLFVEDKFGASAPLGDAFVALVNTVPKLVNPATDRTIAVTAVGTLAVNTVYTMVEHFDLAEVAPSGEAAGHADLYDATTNPTGTATVTPDTAETGFDGVCTSSSNDTAKATATMANGGDLTAAATVAAVAAGTAEVTLTCSDTEGGMSDIAVVTVR